MKEEIDNWLLAPVTQCVLYLSEEIVYSGLVRRGLIAMTGIAPFFALANGHFENNGIDTSPLKRASQDCLAWESKAKVHIDTDFSAVHRHSLIGLWCVVETAIEDSIILILEKSLKAEEMLRKAGYKLKISPIKDLDQSKLRRIYSDLEKQARDRGNVAEAWLSLLAALDVRFFVSEQAIASISEANEVRNCILHRGGEIDQRSASKVPALQPFVGQRIEMGEKQYLAYYHALGEFVTQMIDGVVESSHCKWKSVGD